ncbi:methionine ABC transporter permease [Thermohalobacter berrensis]|uniref:Methionine ABC transporter permease n=1 Tax=Thermohalobacter berrensis TaxID=99594 RepID=A0A419SZ91_9FIRM|nr:methionine ABC transporter permease [Thermohalobacter berrensis]RKD30583.1 methionine ABC transporter permease [Thermohalobacter berrensis]
MVKYIDLLLPTLLETIYMVSVSTLSAILLGFPLGILLVITEKGNILENQSINSSLSLIINISRSFPFIILMILVFPLSRLIVGTTIGTTASIVPLAIAATPFVARIVENSLKEVDKGIIEAAEAMGANNFQIIFKVLLPEAMPSLILGITLTIINLIGYSAMAGAIGGGGLGDLAIRYGLYRFKTDIMIASVLLIILLVQIVQLTGNKLATVLNKKR